MELWAPNNPGPDELPGNPTEATPKTRSPNPIPQAPNLSRPKNLGGIASSSPT